MVAGSGAAGRGVESCAVAVRFILNIIWLVLSGIWLAILYALAGILMCILIITIPFGIQAFKLASYSLWPFGRTV